MIKTVIPSWRLVSGTIIRAMKQRRDGSEWKNEGLKLRFLRELFETVSCKRELVRDVKQGEMGLGGLVLRLANFSWLLGEGFGSNLLTDVVRRSSGAGMFDL